MSAGTTIEWTHRPGTRPATMNAIVGCQPVSEGCRNCYAADTAHVRAGNPLPVMQQKFGGTTRRNGGKTIWTGKVTLSEDALLAPLQAKKPHTYFVNSMSDLFYNGVPDEWVDRHFAVFALCPQHTFIVLTKRPERMRAYLSDEGVAFRVYEAFNSLNKGRAVAQRHAEAEFTIPHPSVGGKAMLPNVWLGVSVEDQATADRRIPELLQTPAAVRFLSMEPLLDYVDLEQAWYGDSALSSECWGDCSWCKEGRPPLFNCAAGRQSEAEYAKGRSGVDWVIVGGESGRKARPMHPDWARSVRDQCAAAGVPFFFKQWGEWAPWASLPGLPPPANDDIWLSRDGIASSCSGAVTMRDARYDVSMRRVGKKAAGHLLDGVEHNAFPEVRA